MVGIYDTGAGGRQIMARVELLNPEIEYRFFEDSEILPLGDKSHSEIQSRVVKICAQLFDEGCNLIILACNTASVHTIRHLQQIIIPAQYPGKNIIGVTRPLIEYTIETYPQYSSQQGSLLATQATINSGFYQQELSQHGFVNILANPASGLADAIERHDKVAITQMLESYSQLHKSDYVILACTHYSLITSQIRQIYPHLTIIDPSQYTAERIVWYMNNHPKYL